MLRGIGASPGIGIGKAYIIKEEKPVTPSYTIADKEAEKKRFVTAVEEVKEGTLALIENVRISAGEEEAAILEGHIMLLSDPALIMEVENGIDGGMNAEATFEAVCDMYAAVFAGMDDELMQQRANDMLDIKDRVIRRLLGMESMDISKLPKGSIVVAKDLTPSMTAGLKPENIEGIVTELGGRTSHSAILSRALEIPSVVAISSLLDTVKNGDMICFDGDSGEVFINPDDCSAFEDKKEAFLKQKKELESFKGKESLTKDGIKVELAANIGNPQDAIKALEYDAEGIGLFRTEFLFMDRETIPTEEEQFEAYKSVASKLQGKSVIIRTLDIGGDKEIPYLGIAQDENPFLGYRAVRLCLDRYEDIYKPQLRAILRASAYGNIKIMIPLITGVDEYRKVKAHIRAIMEELSMQNIAYNKDIAIGVMIETAAASLMADALAKEVDFFSIGTNDLIQYTMSVDRGNDKVSYLYSQYNPAVLRSIKNIILAAKKENIMVGMCGEAAADEKLLPLLLAWGLDEFSMSASFILRMRKKLREYTKEECMAIEEKVMALLTEEEVRTLLEKIC